ncbi:flagella synthesis protein FlgN [Marinagarivorans algicola]|uniref:flagella synthesis protein FlgN n=1 Tax=Marinagarivorans algicola TaxID=1513270 RepID=UPI0006B44A34|nr:flagellar protein FlgN [Marinagarivorans algicola]
MNASNPLNAERLLKSINRDINACNQLISLLEHEHTALLARDTDSLERIINEKSALLSQLNQSAIIRTQWINHYKNSAQDSQEAMINSFSELASEAGLQVQWEHLQSLFQQCKAANDINGKTMARSQVTNERLLNILRGQHNTSHLYDGKGTKGHRTQGNTLGQA